MPDVLIDLEFTGFDNTFITDNEIIQVKLMNTDTKATSCRNYRSKKSLGAHSCRTHNVERYDGSSFTKTALRQQLSSIGVNPESNICFHGFGVHQDIAMLRKYGIHITVTDIREMLLLSEFGYRLATEGSGLEDAYLIALGRIPELTTHDGIEELEVIYELWQKSRELECRDTFDVMPWGHCAGMPLSNMNTYHRS